MVRRLHRRAVAVGHLTLPAVPSMIDEYVTMCGAIVAGLGVQFTPEQCAQLKGLLAEQLAEAYAASSRSNVVISFHKPFGTVVNYRVKAEWQTVQNAYDQWFAIREPPFFGTEPDARVWALSGETADPHTHRVLDIGAGSGRNALALARRGHPVDAVEMAPKFAHMIRLEAERQALDVRVIERDIFAIGDDLARDYQLIVASEVVPDFRDTRQLREMFELAARRLAPGGHLVFNAFLPRRGYIPDDAARELGAQCNTMIFTRDEMAGAAGSLPLRLVADDPAYEYEKTHLPESAWPPTRWYAHWATGLDLFDVERDESPIELRWLVYQKADGEPRPGADSGTGSR
ncbi:hypothetical protein MBOT_31190 [Mycobacterium botniense]|uniref:Methyltransferase domain-containing protein n=2 Tax=Mycobacterium botniense TaxID=84962 RepID=A0A7I9Y128_9MYCO|nr:hypothetical protein MBOT_31190 [Mycobacterium botniense]